MNWIFTYIGLLSYPLLPLCDEVHTILVIYDIIKRSAEDEVLCRGTTCPRCSFPFRSLLTSCLTGGRRASVVDRTDTKSRRRQEKTLEKPIMIEIYPNLFIGSWIDYEKVVSGQPGWAIVHACKTYHRNAIGYKLWNVPRHHPEYLLARRENRIMLCLLDLPVSRFIKKEMIDQTLDFIDEAYSSGLKVLVHCMYGRSRSPSITMLYLATRQHVLSTESFEAAEKQFRRLYPMYHPNRGIREHLRRNWQQYCADGQCGI